MRICKSGEMRENYLERYGLLQVPKEDGTADARIEDGAVILPNGRRLEFFTRPQTDDEFWQGEEDYLLDRFREKIPISRIEGRPDEVLPPSYEVLEGRDSERTFGISFGTEGGERFFGLGEAGRDRVGKKGVVRDAQVHLDVVKEILQFIDADMGWTAQNLSFSPIKGPEGNIEFLVHILPKCRATHCVTEQEAAEVVRQAHESLGNA